MYHLKQKWGIFVTKKDKEILFSNPLFASLGQSECEGLIKSGRAKICIYEKGKAITTASSFTRCLIVILKGSASVSKIGADGRRTVINILRCGDIFGMATLFFEQDFPSEIIAEEPCRLAIFPKELVEEAFAASPEFAKAYVTLLSQKIHFLNSRLSTFTEGETSERFLRWLSAVSGGKTEFCLPCSISRAAETIGVGRASLYRAIGVLSEEKVLKHEGKNIVILKPERLLK